MQTEALVKIGEVARMLGVTAFTIRAWVKAGRLPVLRLSKRTVRFDAAEVMRTIRKRRAEE
ncbi:MAG: helix-turn-helix domain-containing protein [Planctomycetes bacterium]|nr:helix-turn-helix domain-containing protein [Planctomycetota bacterium]